MIYVSSKSNKQTNLEKNSFCGSLEGNDELAGSGSISQRHAIAGPGPDPYQHVTDPQYCC
jgi:hypothetical protein